MEIQISFLTDALPVELIWTNSELIFTYIGFCADWLLVKLSAPKIFLSENQFPWMEMISLQEKIDVSEKHVENIQWVV